MRALKRSDRGTVTAEFAIIFPAVVAVAVLIVSLTRVITVQLDCHSAAREAAYAIVLAEESAVPHEKIDAIAYKKAREVSGDGTSVQIRWTTDSFEVTTTCDIARVGQLRLPLEVYGQAKGARHVEEQWE